MFGLISLIKGAPVRNLNVCRHRIYWHQHVTLEETFECILLDYSSDQWVKYFSSFLHDWLWYLHSRNLLWPNTLQQRKICWTFDLFLFFLPLISLVRRITNTGQILLLTISSISCCCHRTFALLHLYFHGISRTVTILCHLTHNCGDCLWV